MAETLSNFATSILNDAGGISAGDTTAVVADGSTFPATGNFRIRIDDELILVATRTGTSLSGLTRGIEGTVAVSHADASAVYGVLTRTGLETFIEQEARDATVGGQVTGTVSNQTVANTHGTSGTTSHHAQTHTEAEHTTAIRVSDEGSDQGPARVLDFVGSGVSASVSSGTGTITISGGGGGGGSPPYSPAYVVASSDAPQSIKDIADATCDLSADQVQINTAISAATGAVSTTLATAMASHPRGTVMLTAGRFNLSGPILMKRGVNLQGQGVWTYLTVQSGTFTDAGAGTGGAMIKLFSGDEQLVSVSEMYMAGGYSSGFSSGCLHGIYFREDAFSGSNIPVTSPDPVVRIHDVVMLGFDESSSPGTGARHGVWCDQGSAWAAFFTRIRGKDISGNGFYMSSAADSHISDCQFSAGNGFYINGGNNMMTNCKTWYCNSGYGFRFASGRTIASNLESQDDVSSYLFDGAPTNASNIQSDTAQTTGIMISSNKVRVTNFVVFNRGNGAFATTATGLNVDAAYADCMLIGYVDPSAVTTPINPSVAGRLPATSRNWCRVGNGSGTTMALSIGT